MTPEPPQDARPAAGPPSASPPVARAPLHAGGLIAALVIFALGAGVSVLLWQKTRADAALEIERHTQDFASRIAGVLEARINGELEALRRRAELWSAPIEAGPPPRIAEPKGAAAKWKREAELFLDDHPGFRALVRMRPGTANEIAASPDGEAILREVAPQLVALVGKSDAPTLASEVALGPILLSDGRVVLGVQFPLLPRGTTSGVVLGVFEPRAALDPILENRAPGYALAVRQDHVVLYERGTPDVEAAERFTKQESITPTLGSPWTVEVTPSSEFVSGTRADSPAIVLVAGLLISALVSSLVNLAQLSRGRARALELLNLELRSEVSSSRRGEDEIRRLNEALESRVQQRTAELNETITELETFNYSVSHDLRSPLGAIINLAAILAEDYSKVLDGDGREYLRRIVVSATTAVSLMDALLAFSRSGRDEIHRTTLDMRRVMNEVAAEMKAASPDLACSFEIGELPPVHADPVMMRFIVTNLLHNACKFVRKGEQPHVEVGGYVTDGEVTYFVRDHGVGFDMKYADKLFKVFERLHSGEDYGGHGVGLAIVARMVRRHGGRVWAQGAPDKGATFYFSLPAGANEEHAGKNR